MHPNTALFGQEVPDKNIEFAINRGFGTWVVQNNKDSTPFLATAPFYVEPVKPNKKVGNESGVRCITVKAHLMRSNPLYKAAMESGGLPCTLLVSGPDGYISPDWYGIDNQVPTWNYVTVHMKGTMRVLPDEQLLDVLDHLSDNFEAKLSPKPIWKSSKMDPTKMKAFMQMIGPVVLEVEDIVGTWKLGQNKIQAARDGVANQMANLPGSNCGLGLGLEELAILHHSEGTPKCEGSKHTKAQADIADNNVVIKFGGIVYEMPLMWLFLAVLALALFVGH